jgi:hypothetical protein
LNNGSTSSSQPSSTAQSTKSSSETNTSNSTASTTTSFELSDPDIFDPSFTSTIASSSPETSLQNVTYNGCYSKLEFGSMSNIARVVRIYCYRMCKLRCDKILNDHEKNKQIRQTDDLSKLVFVSDEDIIACLETCPVLCSCN